MYRWGWTQQLIEEFSRKKIIKIRLNAGWILLSDTQVLEDTNWTLKRSIWVSIDIEMNKSFPCCWTFIKQWCECYRWIHFRVFVCCEYSGSTPASETKKDFSFHNNYHNNATHHVKVSGWKKRAYLKAFRWPIIVKESELEWEQKTKSKTKWNRTKLNIHCILIYWEIGWFWVHFIIHDKSRLYFEI